MGPLFEVDRDKNFVVNKTEALKIKEYEVLYKRDKGSNGDSSGRAKKIFNAEIYYIYLVHDVRSAYYRLPVPERKQMALRDSGLGEAKWKEDKEFLEAVARYKEDFKLTASGAAYVAAEQALYSIAQDTMDNQEEVAKYKELIKGIKERLNKQGPQGLGDMEKVSAINEVVAVMGKITSLQKEQMTNIKGFKDLQKQVKELAGIFIEEGGSVRVPAGGYELGRREE